MHAEKLHNITPSPVLRSAWLGLGCLVGLDEMPCPLWRKKETFWSFRSLHNCLSLAYYGRVPSFWDGKGKVLAQERNNFGAASP